MSPLRADKHPHAYEVHCHWTGSTGLGYEHYDRTHLASAPPASPSLTLSADRAFRGDPNLLNPEQLLVLAAMSCQLLSFLAVAARARIDVVEYDDVGGAVMPDDDPPVRVTEIHLRPVIRVGAGPTEERVLHLVRVAHRECYIANSLRTIISIEPRIIISPSHSSP